MMNRLNANGVVNQISRRFLRAATAACLILMPPVASANQFVKLDYNLTLNNRSRDTVFLELFDDKPLTQANFMAYVNAGKWDDDRMFMNRLSHGFVMQGGGFYWEYQDEPTLPNPNFSLKSSADVRVDLDGNPATPNPTIMNEYSVGTIRSNLRGTVAMARKSGLPNSASNEWFVSYKNNSFLDTVDGGFTVFGEVRGDGMTYYDALDTLQSGGNPGMLIVDLNQDADNNGVRDSPGVFGLGPNDGVPLLFGLLANLVIVQNADRIDYYGNTGSSTTLNFPAGGYTISARDVFFDTGTTFTGTGGLTIGAGKSLGVREGIALNRNVNNLGTLAPGLQNANLTVQSYQQGASGTLAIDIRGTTSDTHYDRLSVTGTAQLNGKLEVTLLNQFTPKPGDAFNVVAANLITGAFSTIDLPALNRFIWTVSQQPTGVTLSVLAGDYNNNGVVDTADYTVWRNTLATSYATAYTGADGNGDKLVNNADYDIWKANFGKSDLIYTSAGSGSLAASVPEPASALLLALAVALLTISPRCCGGRR
jgi:cyclophilin family peptidyl-prolyl cis-trans isomerase